MRLIRLLLLQAGVFVLPLLASVIGSCSIVRAEDEFVSADAETREESVIVLETMAQVEEFAARAHPRSERAAQFMAELARFGVRMSSQGSNGKFLAAAVLVPVATSPQAELLVDVGWAFQKLLAVDGRGVVEYTIDMATLLNETPSACCSLGDEVSLTGICGPLSALHSLIQLGKIKKEKVTDSDGKFKKDVLEKMKCVGYNTDEPYCDLWEVERMHEAAKGVDCDNRINVTRGNFTESMKKVAEGKKKGGDCWVHFGSAFTGRVGHIMNINSISEGPNGSYDITTVDTGKQGDGQGNGVPSDPGAQTWRAKGWGGMPPQAPPAVSYRNGGDVPFWSPFGEGVNQMIVQCCFKKE